MSDLLVSASPLQNPKIAPEKMWSPRLLTILLENRTDDVHSQAFAENGSTRTSVKLSQRSVRISDVVVAYIYRRNVVVVADHLSRHVPPAHPLPVL